MKTPYRTLQLDTEGVLKLELEVLSWLDRLRVVTVVQAVVQTSGHSVKIPCIQHAITTGRSQHASFQALGISTHLT
jgi:hypothetical protein